MITYYTLKDYATKFDCDQLSLSRKGRYNQLFRGDQQIYIPYSLD